MKTNTTLHPSRRKKILIVVASVIGVFLIAGGVFAYTQLSNRSSESSQDTNSTNYDSATDDQIKNGASIKDNSVNTESGKQSDTGSDKPAESTSQYNGKTVIGTSISAQNVNNETVQLRFRLDTEVTDGNCVLKLTKSGSSTVTRTSGTFQSGGQYSTCQGFDVAVSDLSPGTWTIDLVFENATKYGHVTGSLSL